MRLWTVHPRYLDPQGLVAAWREALLAQKVLAGGTIGYTRHPQLIRFQAQPDPVGACASFLAGLAEEAGRRAYRFDTEKISPRRAASPIEETSGQLLYEWEHLKAKLRARAPAVFLRVSEVAVPESHPLFRIVPGDIRPWEIQA